MLPQGRKSINTALIILGHATGSVRVCRVGSVKSPFFLSSRIIDYRQTIDYFVM